MMENPDDDAAIASVDAAAADIEVQTKAVEAAIRAEASLASRAQSAAIVESKHLGSNDDAKNFVYREAAVKLLSAVHNKSIDQVVAENCSKDAVFKDFIVSKATQNPANTGVAGYVQELINPVAYGAYLNDLRPMSIVARLPFYQVSFGQNNWAGARFLWRDMSKKASAAYRAEGAPSVVKGALFTSKTLPPYLMSVITHATREALQYSVPNLEAILRSAMLQDTAEALDVSVISTAAASAGVSPAGLLNGIAPITSSGQNLDQIQADVRAMKATFISANVSAGLTWVLDELTVLYLQGVTNALGAYVYREELNAGRWEGLPYVASTNADEGKIILMACGEIAFALSAPEVTTSMEATLHESDSAPAEVGGSTTPVRSLFQTNSWAIRQNLVQSHMIMRAPAVSVLDISAWT